MEPYRGGIEDFRRAVIEMEAWHRLWLFETEPRAKVSFEAETRSRLQALLDRRRVTDLLASQEGPRAFSEVILAAARCRAHGLDPDALIAALRDNQAPLRRAIMEAPASVAAVYAVYLGELGISSPRSEAACRADGMLVRRPPEVELTLADVYYLTHEIFAWSDYGTRPLHDITAAERGYLLRVLPFYALFYAALGSIDIQGELLTCMYAVGLQGTYAGRESLRVLLERQNPDGSFGASEGAGPDRPPGPGDLLHPTLNALTTLLLERDDLRTAPR